LAPDARFEALTTQWTEAFQQAQALCAYLTGSTHAGHDRELLELAHRAIVDEEDPREYLSMLSASVQREPALAVGARTE